MTKSQKYLRTRLAILAWAYERYDVSLVSDTAYDALSGLIDLGVPTDSPALDKWLTEAYSPDTGVWIYSHPELSAIDCMTSSIINNLPNSHT